MTTIYPVARSHQPSSRLYDVPSLENDGANFQTWKYRILMILEMRELMGYVDGTAVASGPSLPLQQSKYLQNDKEACAQITLTLKDEPLNGVLHTKMAKEAWDKLNTQYEGKGKQTIAFLIGDLFRGTLSDETALEPQLNTMRQKGYILSSLGKVLDNSLIAVAMVISLPPSYAVLCTILMSTDDKLTTDSVINAILTEEKSRQDG
ncbi:hypothetical protein PHLCEN_2v3239 [Hermanssonia centrifuga]|uniref:Uncharacterized protein n=1 Tax=Hermanssonia centrifuga TaxID=98765 RepID=A0A2R6QXL7_9APHY|nr:hypothetical protein PHLCEN_2v3239 [Hermanssonia centrifuga]